MAENLYVPEGAAKADKYETILPQLRALMDGEDDLVANMANVASVLKEAFGFFWVGFYRMVDGALVLGPFQGPLACTRIEVGKGVCGSSAQEQKTLVVPDVNAFPGHIACSVDSKSEIVVPLIWEGEVKGVLDVDSDEYNDFDETDQQWLEKVAASLMENHFGEGEFDIFNF
ncbi:MAG: GAF domain-containing protein [Bacteroidota bacterium]